MLRRPIVIAVLAGVLAAPAVAHADAFDKVFADFQGDGSISACRHSDAELRQARKQIPNDIEQYAPDFPDALDQALEERARSGCGGDATTTASTTAAAAPAAATGGTSGGATASAGGTPTTQAQAAAPTATTASGSVPQPPGTAMAASAAADGAIVDAADKQPADGGDAPAPLIVLAVLGGLLLVGLLVWGIARFLAFDPPWLQSARHALAEAGWRAGGAWADFTDWLRRGRTA